jgi:hypothetical protein
MALWRAALRDRALKEKIRRCFNVFKLKENGTKATTEIVAGLTTFFAMAYIIAVNPYYLSKTGMEWGAVFLATIFYKGLLFPETDSACGASDSIFVFGNMEKHFMET